jgi:hypothetical protein
MKVQMPNLALIERKRITVYELRIFLENTAAAGGRHACVVDMAYK